MDKSESLNHTKWDCKYHVVFIPKNRKKVLYGELRVHLGAVFRELAQHKESRIEKSHLMVDHVHMMIAIPPKYPVSSVVGYIKGKVRFTLFSSVTRSAMLAAMGSVWAERPVFAERCSAPGRTSAGLCPTAARSAGYGANRHGHWRRAG